MIPTTNFTVWANNSGGTASANITLTVLVQDPMFLYDPSIVVLLNSSSDLEMIPISTAGEISDWNISPQLSPGLFFDTETGILSGTPTLALPPVQYLITASNAVGSSSVTVNITVEDLEYQMMNGTLMLVNNSLMHAFPPISLINAANYEIEPELPAGLYFNSTNGTIWGTPVELLQSQMFIVFANN